jgi:hypothetical protein
VAKISSKSLKAARQQKVAQLDLRGLTQREIVKALEKQRIINPNTGKSWSLATVNSDLKELEARYREEALKDRTSKKAHLNAELQELKRAAWSTKDLRLVADLLRQERQLFGLDAPANVNVNGRLDGEVNINHQIAAQAIAADMADMEEDDIDLLIQNLMIAAGVDAPVIIEGSYEVSDGV